ncbi:DUF6074 family protein [Mesorhizobium sp. BH1-1-5]|uniref:DUF6074 family protein n=1 Tax=Mesorhizobium sp. BH1-1-5 TaxID=2876661 RepID=UPI001CCA0B5F|nr:DUF6074 family protein [Mesorhizobium sp. BH1-1-5]MBZ9991133.1 DUF6074 family protein [Mesorhizobium sp. BH1-1-5]
MSVHAYPISRELLAIRIVADAIARLPNEAAAQLWRETATHLLSVAIERGQNANDARAEVRRFFDEVQIALHSDMSVRPLS